MKNPFRSFWAFLGFFLIVSLMLLFFRDTWLAARVLESIGLHSDFKPPTVKPLGPAPLVARPAATAAPSSPPPLPLLISPENQDLIRHCLGRDSDLPTVHYGSDLSLKNLIQDLSGESPPAPTEQSMNFHIQKADGKVLRLHIIPAEKQQAINKSWVVEQWNVSLFNVDSENLPVRTELPESLKLDTLQGVVANFLASGSLIFKERHYSQRLGQNISVEVVEENDQIKTLQLFFGTDAVAGSLGCAWTASSENQPHLDCNCLP
jgi:hypothetical protein